MDSLCVRVGTVCGLDSGVGQVRHPKDGFNGCDCNPDNRGSGLFMADGVHRRLAGTAFRNQRKNASVPDSVRPCNRRKLAVLFPCAADRRYQ